MSGSSAAIIVAQYLSANFPSVLPNYLQEAGLSQYQLNDSVPDLRTIIEDWSSDQLNKKLARTKLDAPRDDTAIEELLKRRLPEGEWLTKVDRTIEGISAVNLIAVKVERVPVRRFDTSTASYRSSYPLSIITTSVDRSLKIIDYLTGEVETILQPHRAAILSFSLHPVKKRYLLTGSMDGTAILTDLITSQPIQTFKHQKFVVRTAFSQCGKWMATASHDKSINVYSVEEKPSRTSTSSYLDEDDDAMLIDDEDDPELAKDPDLRYVQRFRLETTTNPEAIVFHPDSTHLIFTTRSSHLLQYLALPALTETSTIDDPSTPFVLSSKSFNPHPHDTHVSFSVLDLAVHPSGKIIACLTGDHAGNGGERILLYSVDPPSLAPFTQGSSGESGGSEERLGCLWTGTLGDEYVLPRMGWLPDGTAIVTTTTTGHLILIDISGHVRSKLKVHGGVLNGVNKSEVVRDLAVVNSPEDKGGWAVVSCGYDFTIRVTK